MFNPPEFLGDTVSCKIVRIGYIVLDSYWWNFKRLCSDTWRVYLPQRNGSWIDLPDRRYQLTAGYVHVIPSGTLFDCGCDGLVPKLYIHFNPVGLPATLIAEPMAIRLSGEMESISRRLVDQFTSGNAQEIVTRLQTSALLHLVMTAIVEHLSTIELTTITELVARHDPIAPVVQFIESHLNHVMTNTELAELCNFSPDHFVRRFKEATSQTPAQYILSRRIAAAAKRLITSSDSIEQIAEQLGFLDRFHFTRVFTRKMGIGPAAYRKSAAQQPGSSKIR